MDFLLLIGGGLLAGFLFAMVYIGLTRGSAALFAPSGKTSGANANSGQTKPQAPAAAVPSTVNVVPAAFQEDESLF
jgi:hypothetical protein